MSNWAESALDRSLELNIGRPLRTFVTPEPIAAPDFSPVETEREPTVVPEREKVAVPAGAPR